MTSLDTKTSAIRAAELRGHTVALDQQPGGSPAHRWTCRCGASVFANAGQVYGMATETDCTNGYTRDSVVYLATCQFAWGGVFDSKPVDDLLHLVRGTLKGTPGHTLCGIDRFAQGSPGFNMGGGVTKHGQIFTPCPGCVEVACAEYPGVPAAGLTANCDFATALGVPSAGHSHDITSRLYFQRDLS